MMKKLRKINLISNCKEKSRKFMFSGFYKSNKKGWSKND